MPRFSWRVATEGYAWQLEADDGGAEEFDTEPKLYLDLLVWEFRTYAPMSFPGLFRTFADTAPTPTATLAFANEWGNLGDVFSEPDEPDEPPDDMDDSQRRAWVRDIESDRRIYDPFSLWSISIKKMRQCVELWDARRRGQNTPDESERLLSIVEDELGQDRMEVRIERSERTPSGFALDYLPRNLLGALWLQLALAICENKDFRQCAACGKWFELSPTEHRTSRRYCSEACRSRAYRDRKVQATRMAAAGRSPEEIAETLKTKATTVKRWLSEVASE